MLHLPRLKQTSSVTVEAPLFDSYVLVTMAELVFCLSHSEQQQQQQQPQNKDSEMSIPPAMWTGPHPPPFTAAQWQELEHQALIFKYLKAGLTVPPDLLAPIQKSFQLMPVPHSALGYSSYFGKKIDPEPGRCRRTDGKKWRCSRDAHPDSKYCERHMIRRRHRSRKPVETSQAPPPPPSQSSEVTVGGAQTGFGNSFPSLPLHTNGTREGSSLGNNNNISQLQIESLPGEINKKEFRFGLQSEVDEHDFFQKDMRSVRYLGFDSSSNSMWSQLSHISSNAVSELSDSPVMASNCFQMPSMPGAEQQQPLLAASNIDALTSKQFVFNGQLGSTCCVKQQGYHQPPQTLINAWPWKKELGSAAVMEYKPNKDVNGNLDVNVDCCGSL